MNSRNIWLCVIVMSATSCVADDSWRDFDVRQQFEYCSSQASRTLEYHQENERIPYAARYGTDQWKTVKPGGWTSGFWSGQLWYLYEAFHSEKWLEAAKSETEKMLPVANRRASSHDVGFMMMTSLGNGWKLTHIPSYRNGLLAAADSLSRLFNPSAGTILSWPHKVEEFGGHNTIIDNMMNLELLFWAAENGGRPELRDIAISHADTTMKYHFRDDGSCYHVAVYDAVTGEFMRGCTHQGYSDDSMWARGQAWAIYGYTMCYRFTKAPRYLEHACKVTDIYLRRLPEDKVPYWDFDDPSVPSTSKDASAAAIVASALLELSQYVNTEDSDGYRNEAVMMLRSLSASYLSHESNSAFLKHSVGHRPAGKEVDCSINYADYYFLEALVRLDRLQKNSDRQFIHPGILHDQESFKRMRNLIKEQQEPSYGSWKLLKEHMCSQYDYEMFGPFDTISRDGKFRKQRKPEMEKDFSGAYQNSIMWMLTGERKHAQKAEDILLAYSRTLRAIPGTNDAPLLVGLEGLKIAYAAEILKHTYRGFSSTEQEEVDVMLKEYFIPVMEKFFKRRAYTNGNWGPIIVKAYMAMAILWDDVDMYERAMDFYLHAYDNGTVVHYIDGDSGQIQESGRDQGHCMLGIGAMATVCEMAHLQGDDLYSSLDNRLMKGFEYVCKYNLGEDVPFFTWTDITGKYSDWNRVSERKRGDFIPIFEMAYNHYVLRKGLNMPYTERVLSQIRPEGYDRDQPAFGSLLFWEQK